MLKDVKILFCFDSRKRRRKKLNYFLRFLRDTGVKANSYTKALSERTAKLIATAMEKFVKK